MSNDSDLINYVKGVLELADYKKTANIELQVWKTRIKRATDRLRDCPCCGGRAVIKENHKSDGYCSYNTLRAVCTKCGLQTRDYTSDGYYGEKYTPEEVVDVWNARVGED